MVVSRPGRRKVKFQGLVSSVSTTEFLYWSVLQVQRREYPVPYVNKSGQYMRLAVLVLTAEYFRLYFYCSLLSILRLPVVKLYLYYDGGVYII